MLECGTDVPQDPHLTHGRWVVSEEKAKLLRLMRFWLFGTFIVVWAAITVYIGLFTNRNWWVAVRAGFPIWGITALLCILWYVGYSYYLKRKAD
jgi:hypothetical protein